MNDHVYKVVKELFEMRKYELKNEEKDRFIGIKPNGETLYVLFSFEPKFSIRCIKEYLNILSTDKVKHAIIVYKDSITPATKKLIAKLSQNAFKIEMFLENEMINPTTHRLTPVHKRLSKEEIEGLKVRKEKLPVILRKDPVARFCGFEKGDVIEIIRKGGFPSYRIVK